MKKKSFDLLAEQYDRDFVDASIGSAQRKLVYHCLEALINIPENLRILDLGCGTGQDVIFMAQLGHHIVGIDSSQEMILKAAEKVEKLKLTGHVELKQLEIIHFLTSVNQDADFGMIFSNFGALNVLPRDEWDKIVTNVNEKSSEGSYLVLIMLNAFCLWETFYFLLTGRWKQAVRRWSRKGVSFTFKKGSMERIYYYTPGKLTSLFKPLYKVKKVMPIGCFVPPSYLQPFFNSRKGLLDILFRLDTLALRLPPLAYLADHFMIIMQKND